ncbi:MAG: hypothetical protein HUJ25_10710 [Crocinitomicaceae bacterium]|nr:hypothetical protein [Crocinitomicaceae bacterium]
MLSYGQMLLNYRGTVLEDMPFFNPEFIKKHQVKSFRGTYATKFDHDIIRPNSDSFVYEFDRLGQLVRKYKIKMGDTLLSTYIYDYRGNVLIHRETNKYGYYEYRYAYDKRDRVTEMEVRRDSRTTQNKLSFELDESSTVAIEKYEYIALEGLDYKKICYNGAGRVYRNEFYYFNEDGRLAKKESALHNGSGRSEVNYFYDAKGRVEEVKTISKATKTHIKKKLFAYDDEDNVLSRHIYRNDKLLSEEQLVYFEDSKLLKAIISREANQAMLTILQFRQYRNY